jgi:hypothetical protein
MDFVCNKDTLLVSGNVFIEDCEGILEGQK